jgi:hypothetical protein
MSIFGGGLFTIIASHGNNADAGLPGISSPRRDLNVAHLNGISISETPGPFDFHPITDTAWNSRGWTFQENIVSRRRPIFLESSIMWSCLTTDRAEEVDLEAKDTEFYFAEGDRYIVSRVNLKFPVDNYPGLVAGSHQPVRRIRRLRRYRRLDAIGHDIGPTVRQVRAESELGR